MKDTEEMKEEKAIMENKARIYIIGAAAVLVSGVRLADWKEVEKYAPEALKVTDEDGDAIFRIVTGPGPGSVNEYGICWGGYTGEEGQATVTVLLDEEIDNRKEAVSEIVGPAMMPLIEIEKKIPDLMAAIAEKKQAAEACITIV